MRDPRGEVEHVSRVHGELVHHPPLAVFALAIAVAIIAATTIVGCPIPQYPDVHAIDRPVPLLPGVDGPPSHPPRPRSGHLDEEDVVIVHVRADAAPRAGEADLTVVHPPAR